MINGDILLWLFAKHFVVDFLLQPEYMWKNKGNLFHPGGYVHSGFHAVVTAAILLCFGIPPVVVVWVAAVELTLHYFIDYSKMNLCKRMELTPDTTGFWYMLGLDQFLHYLTYWIILASV